MARLADIHARLTPAIVWLLRLAIGATFIMSGFVKGIDVWGSVYKISEYLTVWNLSVPESIITIGAGLLAAVEFIWGLLLFFGTYRHMSVWGLLLIMCGMLPLSAYIAIANPVADCGCFGDFWVISNTATFVKNIFITAALIYLAIYNNRVNGLYGTYIQWVIGGLATLYILIIEVYGFNVQPMLDFRRFSEGVELIPSSTADGEDDEDNEAVYEFIYEHDGQQRAFTEDDLPEDTAWVFVDRHLISGNEHADDGFTIIEDGEDVAPYIISNSGEQFIVTIPDIHRADLSSSYKINDLNDFISGRGGSLVTLIGNSAEDNDYWRDISMADYEIYSAEPTLIKELARGNVGLVYLNDGVVQWKRSLASINYAAMSAITGQDEMLDFLTPRSLRYLKTLTGILLIILGGILVLDRSGRLVAWSLTNIINKIRNNKDTTPEP